MVEDLIIAMSCSLKDKESWKGGASGGYCYGPEPRSQDLHKHEIARLLTSLGGSRGERDKRIFYGVLISNSTPLSFVFNSSSSRH